MNGRRLVVAALLICGVALFHAPRGAKAAGDEAALHAQAQKALAERNWQVAADALKKLVVLDPRWEYFQPLGDADTNLGNYLDAIEAYDKGIKVAEADKKAPAATTRTAISAMLTGKGNDLLKLKRNDAAVDAYTKAAALAPNPGIAYFNLCATQYNMGKVDGALAACDKAIKADPKRADAYFIKGSLLVGQSTVGKDNKVTVPPGTVEALRKYLELAPNGGHAADVRQMLDFVK